MEFFYHVFIRVFGLAIRLAALTGNVKAAKRVEGTKRRLNRFKESIWIHCASLGEYEQAKPLLSGIKEKFPESDIVVSFFSSSGFENVKKVDLISEIVYLPIDTKGNAKRFIEAVNPRLAIFVKYEFWFNFISELTQRNIPTYFVSVSVREEHFMFSWYGRFLRDALQKVQKVFTQNLKSQQLLEQYGFKNIELAGDTRFDRVLEIANNTKPIEVVERFKGTKELLVVGSSWSREEDIVREFIAKTEGNNLQVILAPHDISVQHLTEIESKFGSKVVRFSQYEDQDSGVLLIDNIGLLSSIYAYADIAFVGGGFTNALHNILEPAAHGVPVFYGNDCPKFPEAAELAEAGGGYPIATTQEFGKVLDKLIGDQDKRTKAAQSAKRFIEDKTGATQKILSSFE